MRWDEVAQFLHSGAAMLGTSADEGGRPEAFRIWGARAASEGRVRVLASADARQTFGRVEAGTPIAVLLTDITTFRSLQLKGRATGGPLPPDPDDMTRYRQYDEQFHEALRSIGHPPRLGMSIRPMAVYAVEVELNRLFDQTPGPTAGSPA